MKDCRKILLKWFTIAAGLAWAQTVPGDPGTPSALWLPYVLLGDDVLPTYGASVAVDPQGGVHAAYSIYAGADLAGNRPAIYAYCPTNFAERSNWTFVMLGENVQDVRLALDPQGRPRLMLFGPAGDPDAPSRMRYQYAECNIGWTNAANWAVTTICAPEETTVLREYDNNRYFAISPQGTAAFVYTEKIDYYHEGLVYASCSGDCTDPSNWTETMLTSSYVDQPSLTFSPQGRPRLAFGLFENADLYLAYAECDGDPHGPNQWAAVVLSQIHGSATFSLQTDANGRPRIALSSGSYATPPFADHQLYYLWCTEGSISDLANWRLGDLAMSAAAGGVDLALDRQGRPRISYQAWDGLGCAWCNGTAESADAVWQHRTVESDASIAASNEVLPITRCTLSSWNNGQRSSLALDKFGNPRIAYDAEHTWSGNYTDPPYGTCNFKDVTITRFAFVSLSPRLSIQRSGSNITIFFENGTLESAPATDGPWSALEPATSPLVLPTDQPQQFYRLRQ